MAMKSKQISGPALIALKEALTHIYWTKSDLKLFVSQTISNTTFVSTINFEQYKRGIASDIVDRMSQRSDIYEDDLLALLKAVSDMTDFSHLKKWDDGDKKIKAAKDTVNALRQHTKGFFELEKEKERIAKSKVEHTTTIKKNQFFRTQLESLKTEFFRMTAMTNKQQRGFDFEKFLNSLFILFDLDPKCSYKTESEQIDGAFTHENQDYLIEAKWEDKPMAKSSFYTFEGKVRSKLKTTLGLYISISGFSEECNRKDESNVILMDYMDIMMVVDNRIDLPTLIYRKKQHAAQTGNILFHPQC